jgi:hypothetical protein
MANILNEGLSRTLGIEFEFKLKLQTLLTEFKDNPIVQAETTQATAAATALTKFIKCGPSMGFETKRNAYACLEQIVTALKNSSSVPATDDTALTSELVNVTKFVGLEGEEDFHFMVAVFNLCELISGVVGEVETEVVEGVAPEGGVVTITLIDGGSGYTDAADGTVNYFLFSTEDTGGGDGNASVTSGLSVVGGIFAEIGTEDIGVTVPGADYSVGDIVIVALDNSGTIPAGATPALAEVTKLL